MGAAAFTLGGVRYGPPKREDPPLDPEVATGIARSHTADVIGAKLGRFLHRWDGGARDARRGGALMVSTNRRTLDLGRASDTLAEALAWLNSPAAIAGEINALERAQAGGNGSEATRALLRDWRAIQRVQAILVQLDDETKEAA